MNFFYYYIKIVKEYFSNKYFSIVSCFVIFFIYFLHFLLTFLINFENFNLVYWHFIAPFFVYISMIFFISLYYCEKKVSNKSVKVLFFTLLLKGLFIIIIKLIWNFLKVILIESNIIKVTEDSHLYPLFLLGFSWGMIYFASGYFVYCSLLKDKKKIKSFFHYSIEEFWQLLVYLFFSFFFSFMLIIFISFIISKIQNLVIFFQNDHIHKFIEDILTIAFNVFFAHMIALLLVENSIKNKRTIK